ncbi:MAG: histidinol phosphate phosphatase domain-containing protein, partial [Thermotogota bacterium]|nr:histidinol phosphate phosphatase domain-containing protein [Thermotogota bacterium]
MNKVYDFHTHTILSDGELICSEQIRHAQIHGYAAIAISDHVDESNIDFVLSSLNKFVDNESSYFEGIKIFKGVEITHVPPLLIDGLAKHAKENGADIVLVHGETIVEPVFQKTNYYAVTSKYVDILAHPGLISEEEVALAASNGVFLELSTRKGHSLSNGHVRKLAQKYEAKLLVNSDAHGPEDFLDYDFSLKVALSAGLSIEE